MRCWLLLFEPVHCGSTSILKEHFFGTHCLWYVWSIILKLYHWCTTRAKKVKGNSFWYLSVLKFPVSDRNSGHCVMRPKFWLIPIPQLFSETKCFDTWFVFIYLFNYLVVASVSSCHMNILLIQTNKLSDNSSGTNKSLLFTHFLAISWKYRLPAKYWMRCPLDWPGRL